MKWCKRRAFVGCRDSGVQRFGGAAALRRFAFAVLVASTGVILSVAAQEQPPRGPTSVMLNREVEIGFPPESGVFVVQFDAGPYQRVPAVLTQSVVPMVQSAQGREAPKWLVGAVVAIPAGVTEVRSFGVVVGGDRQAVALPFTMQEVARLPFDGDSEERLRAHLMERKGMVSSLKLKVAEQESMLRRLREDAEVVGNFARVVDAREELSRVKASTLSVEKDIANLEQFLKLANSYPAPKNYRNREQQLAAQLIELTETARNAEQGEFSRRQAAHGETQTRLQLLEASRTGDIPALQEQLSILRSERERLE